MTNTLSDISYHVERSAPSSVGSLVGITFLAIATINSVENIVHNQTDIYNKSVYTDSESLTNFSQSNYSFEIETEIESMTSFVHKLVSSQVDLDVDNLKLIEDNFFDLM